MDRPLLGRTWAETGDVVEIEDEKYLKGFVAEIPTYEHLNFLQQKIDNTLNSLAQRGVLEWGEDVPYVKGSLAWDDDDIIYVCLSDAPSRTISPKDNEADWSISVIQLSKADFQSLADEIHNHIDDMNNPHGTTAEQLNVYTKGVTDSLILALVNNIEAHKADQTNPHNNTALDIGAVPSTGGTYTGQVELKAEETLIGSSEDAALVGSNSIVGFRNKEVSAGIAADGRLVKEEAGVVTDVYMSEDEYLVKRKSIEHLYSPPVSDFRVDLVNDLSIKRGLGICEFTRPSSKTIIGKNGESVTLGVDIPAWTVAGLDFKAGLNEKMVMPATDNIAGFKEFTLFMEFVSDGSACELYSDNSTKSDKIYINSTGVVFIDLHTSSGTKRTIEVGSVLPNIPNRFSLTVSGANVVTYLNGVPTFSDTFDFAPDKTYTEFYVARVGSVTMRRIEIWSVALTLEQQSNI